MYQINLYYGYEENECGIFHSFQAESPDAKVDTDEMRKALAEQLDVEADDDRFNWGSMYINLPESVVAKIQADTIRAIQQKYNLVSLSDIADKALKELSHQLREGKNLNSFGEPVAVTELPNGRYIEVTAERDGLEPREYHYTVRVLSDTEEDYEMARFSTRNESYQNLRSAVTSAVRSYAKSQQPTHQRSLSGKIKAAKATREASVQKGVPVTEHER